MLAYMVAGLILGALAWQLKHEPEDPRPASQFIIGVVGAVVGEWSATSCRART